MDLSRLVVTRAVTKPNDYMEASMRIGQPLAYNGTPPQFNQADAVHQFRGWVYAAINLNSIAVASTPLRLYMRKRKGTRAVESRAVKNRRRIKYMRGELGHNPSLYVTSKMQEWGEDFEEVTEQTQLTKLLTQPNPYMSGSEFTRLKMSFLQATGNFYQQPVLSSLGRDKRIDSLWVCPSQFMKIVPGNPKIGEWIHEYIYGHQSPVEKRFKPDEINHMKLPNMEDMFYGMGSVQAGWPVIVLSDLQKQQDIAQKRNQSRPDYAVITESSNITPQQLEQMNQHVAAKFRGGQKTGTPIFLSGKTQVVPLNWAPTEIGDREITVEEIAAVMNVPVSILKANDPNLASATVGFAFWMKMGVLPLLRVDEEYMNNAFMPLYDMEDDAFLAYDDPVPENSTELAAEITAYGPMLTTNEKRAMIGEEPSDEPNADKIMVPSGMQFLDKVGELPAMGAGGFTMGGSSNDRSNNDRKSWTSNGNDAGNNGREGLSSIIQRGEVSARHVDSVHIKQSDTIYAHHAHGIQTKGDASETAREGEKETLISKMTRDLNEVFDAQRRECVGRLTGKKSLEDGKLVLDMLARIESYTTAIQKAVDPYMTAQVIQGGKMGLDSIDVPNSVWEVSNARVAEYIRQYTIKLAGEINGYTIQRLSATLGEGLESGDSISQLAQRVQSEYEDFSGYRAEMIARTESARAYTAGSEAAWHESGVVKGKRWVLAPGACPVCNAIAAEFNNNPVPLNEPFYQKGSVIPLAGGGMYKVDYMSIYGPPSHPGCRCALEAVT